MMTNLINIRYILTYINKIKTNLLFLVINTFHALRDTCQYFIRYCITSLCNSFYRIILIEQDCSIVFFTIDSCQIDHAHIHTDISDNRSGFSIYIKTSIAVAEFSLQTLGLTNRNNANTRLLLYLASPAVTNSLPDFIFFYLNDSGFQRNDGT